MSWVRHERLARAKVNLFLRVLGRREDGFHEIETLMVPVDLADRLVFERLEAGAGLRFSCDDPSLPGNETNLVVRAIREVEVRCGQRFDLAVHLEKRIPHGAGLGGGSSDAASVLSVLDEKFGLGLGLAELGEIAGQLGSDIPFFLYGGPCRCRGRGERVLPDPLFIWRPALLLVKPAFSVPTPWAYREWRESRELPGIDHGPQPMPWGELVNDLERPVFAKHLVLAELKRFLRASDGVEGALMSGSGAVVFAVLGDGVDGEALGKLVREEFGETTWTQVVRVMP